VCEQLAQGCYLKVERPVKHQKLTCLDMKCESVVKFFFFVCLFCCILCLLNFIWGLSGRGLTRWIDSQDAWVRILDATEIIKN